MEGPTVTESGPNLDHSYQEGAGRCEVNFGSEMSSSHTDEGEQSDPPQALPGGNTLFRGPSNEAPVCSQHAERVGGDTESPSKHFTVEQNAEQANQVISTKTGNSCPPNEFLKDPSEKDGGQDPGCDADGHELARSSTTGNLEPIITVTHHELACLSDEEDSRETALAIYYNEPKVSCPSSKQEDLGKEAEPDRHKSESSGDSTPTLLDRSAREIEAKPNTKETPVEEKGSKEAESSEQKHAEPQREKITGVYDWNGQSHYTSMESDMLSPVATPSGHHHHMQTQVSLETPACHSAATSPMTPPQGSGSYFFPYSFRKAGLNEGTQPPVYRSVATAPMSPLSPAVPESPCPEIKVIEARELMGCQGPEGADDQPGAKKLPGYGKVSGCEVDGSADRATRGEAIRVDSLLPVESVNKIQKDTPLVDSTPSSVSGSGTTPGTVTSNGVLDQTFKPRIDAGTGETVGPQTNQSTGSSVTCENNSKREVVPQSTMPNEDIHDTQDSEVSPPKCGTQPTVASEAMIQERASRGRSVLAETRQVTLAVLSHDGGQSHDAPMETDLLSPAVTPSGHHHHMQTQVSLEKPSCHSAATSPMTPPQGSGAFFFPYSFRKAGLNEGTQLPVYRSVATAPMSPLSPAVPESPCPEIKVTAAAGAMEVIGLQGTEGEDRDAELAEVKACDDQQESVQDVRWDDRGMTWEVYGAAVEVDVLGTAIQKHLEKQGEEPGKQPPPLSPPVSPPLSPPPPPPNSATIPAPSDPPSSPSPPPHPPSPPSPPTQSPPPPVSAPSSSSSAEGEPVACDAGVVEEVVVAQESGEAEEVGVAGDEQGQEGKKGKRRRRNPFRTVLRNIRRPRCCSRTHTIE